MDAAILSPLAMHCCHLLYHHAIGTLFALHKTCSTVACMSSLIKVAERLAALEVASTAWYQGDEGQRASTSLLR